MNATTYWCLCIHNDNHNNSGTHTTTRVQHALSSSSLWKLQPPPPNPPYATTLPPANYTLETVTYAQAIPLHVGGSGVVVTEESEREKERERTRAKAEQTPPPTNKFILLRCPKREPVCAYFVHNVQGRGSGHDDADPCVACDRRLCARDTDCGAVVGD